MALTWTGVLGICACDGRYVLFVFSLSVFSARFAFGASAALRHLVSRRTNP